MSTTRTETTTYLSPSCQQMISSSLTSLHQTSMTIRTCISDPLLAPTITNHRCNNVILTPSGLYTDMAITVSTYLWNHHRGPAASAPGINVCDLEVHKPLIVKDVAKMDEQWLEMEVTASLPANVKEDIINAELHCTFYSITPAGRRLQTNGTCTVRFEWYYGWLSEWSLALPHITSRINALTHSPTSTTVSRAKAYKLFESFVQYTGPYQNMSTCIFDAETLEATSVLDFLPRPETDYCGPYYHDGSCHVSGFVCNAVEQNKESNAFISNGVTAMKLSPLFDPTKAGSGIRNYVQMKPLPNDKSVLQGDVYVIQDGQIVGVWEGVRFKKIPRRVLNVFLPPGKK